MYEAVASDDWHTRMLIGLFEKIASQLEAGSEREVFIREFTDLYVLARAPTTEAERETLRAGRALLSQAEQYMERMEVVAHFASKGRNDKPQRHADSRQVFWAALLVRGCVTDEDEAEAAAVARGDADWERPSA